MAILLLRWPSMDADQILNGRWSLREVARAASEGRWRSSSNVRVVFGVNVDQQRFWCTCCCHGEKKPPDPTYMRLGIRNVEEARKIMLELVEMKDLLHELVHGCAVPHTELDALMTWQ